MKQWTAVNFNDFQWNYKGVYDVKGQQTQLPVYQAWWASNITTYIIQLKYLKITTVPPGETALSRISVHLI